VIPVRNGAATIAQQLEALSAQTYRGTWELVIADNGSTDGTRTVVQEWSARLPSCVVVDASGRRGPSFARNSGARAATGDFLAFCDADDVVGAKWLESFADAAQTFDIVAGQLDDAINPDSVRSSRPPRAQGLARSSGLPFAPSGNFGVWKRVFDATGGFDERFAQCEDVEWSWRAQLAGFELGFAPEAVVQYRYRASARDIARQGYGRGVSFVRLYKSYRSEGVVTPRRGRALRRWAWIVVRSPYLFSMTRRGTWLRRASESAGRLVGSVRFRVICL